MGTAAGATPISTISAAKEVLRKYAQEDVGFLQFFNSHKTSKVVRALVHDPVLAATAAQLLGCDAVRLYQV